ncbi:hypothetical protein JDM601_1428 [Mycolicibacter sinensis]|uniref:Uncharacterized protein n=4 Tax=Mycobacteriaceae TaxID=1762 RepID=F5YY49_MYCSD|nr:hypothetical protein JDM601_1428 [Mycolicibacter sinensis]BBX11380.1 hypothetical protein MNVM_04610 [Mycobacterium novum]GFG84383.1 hypothetical protein MALGJ_10590 [Mycolicibacter algericus]
MFSILLLADRLRCALSTAAVVTLDSLRIAAAVGSGSLAFFEDVGDGFEDVADSVGDSAADGSGADEVVGAEVGAVVDGTVEVTADDETDGAVGGVDEQPATRAAAALATVSTAGSLRMPAMLGAREPADPAGGTVRR